MSVTVDRAHAQRMAALKRANHARLYRAGVKRRVGSMPTQAGLRAAAELASSPPDEMGTMKVEELLLAPRRVGRETVRVWLRKMGVRGSLELGRLSPRQRAVVAAWLIGEAVRRS